MDTIATATAKRVFVGSLIIIAGILLLLSNIGYFNTNIAHVIFSWPMILVVFGGIMMIGSNFRSGFTLTSIGVVFMVAKYYYLDIWLFWPVILIIIGINALLRSRRSPGDYKYYNNNSKDWKEYKKSFHGHHVNWVEAERDWKNTHEDWKKHRDWKYEEQNTDFIHESNVFSGSRKFIHSDEFKGGKVTAVFGGSEIDLSGCKLAPGNNILDVETVFGGITLFVPDDWKVIIDVSPVFGDFSDERRLRSVENVQSDSVLVIRGSLVFGGGKIKSA